MYLDAALAYLHYAAILFLVWFLAREWQRLAPAAPRDALAALARIDALYAVAAVAVLATGASRAIWGLKGWAFYAGNPVFHAKIGMFVLVAIVSIRPTLMFMRWKKAQARDPAFRPDDAQWRRARRLVLAQMHGLALIPLLAVLMSRGIGYGG